MLGDGGTVVDSPEFRRCGGRGASSPVALARDAAFTRGGVPAGASDHRSFEVPQHPGLLGARAAVAVVVLSVIYIAIIWDSRGRGVLIFFCTLTAFRRLRVMAPPARDFYFSDDSRANPVRFALRLRVTL